MLILAKAAMAMMLGFILAVVIGAIILSILKKRNIKQVVSKFVPKTHQAKTGTPTMGGFIFIIPVIISLLILYLRGSINISYNLVILILVFLSYALLGFVDDYLKVHKKNNDGVKTVTKLLFQTVIALVFFYLYLKGGGSSTLTITFLKLSIEK